MVACNNHHHHHNVGTHRGRHDPHAALRDRFVVRLMRSRRHRQTRPPRGVDRLALGADKHRADETTRPRHIHLPPRDIGIWIRAQARVRRGHEIGIDDIVDGRRGELLSRHRVLGGHIEATGEGQEPVLDERVQDVLRVDDGVLGMRGG